MAKNRKPLDRNRKIVPPAGTTSIGQIRRAQQRTKATTFWIRHLLLASTLGWYFRRYAGNFLLPYGPAIPIDKEDIPIFSPIDYDNDSLRYRHGKLSKIYERLDSDDQEPLLKGPEKVIFSSDGVMYTTTEEGKLLSITDLKVDKQDKTKTTAKVTEVASLGMGRPLGAKFDSKESGTLYVADTLLGLTRLRGISSTTGTGKASSFPKVELVSSRVKTQNGTMSQILYANDVDIGPKSGYIYFTDSTDIPPERIGTRTWDTLYMSKLTYARGIRNGRLLRYDPKTDETIVLLDGIFFANGVSVSKDETYIHIIETFAGRSLKYYLQSNNNKKKVEAGTVEVMADKFPGYGDNGDCHNNKCWVALASSKLSLMDSVYKAWPSFLSVFLRSLILMMPKSVAPKVNLYGSIVEIDASEKKIIRILQDPTGVDIAWTNSATYHKNKLYIGSLRNDFIGVYDLS